LISSRKERKVWKVTVQTERGGVVKSTPQKKKEEGKGGRGLRPHGHNLGKRKQLESYPSEREREGIILLLREKKKEG